MRDEGMRGSYIVIEVVEIVKVLNEVFYPIA